MSWLEIVSLCAFVAAASGYFGYGLGARDAWREMIVMRRSQR